MNKKIPLIAITALFFLFAVKLQAEPYAQFDDPVFNPKIYIGLGYELTLQEKFSNIAINNVLKANDINSSRAGKAIDIILGLYPNLPFTPLKGLRFQVEYDKSFANKKILTADMLALGAYFDFYLRDMQLVVPYVGVSVYYPISLAINIGDGYTLQKSTFFTSFNAGVAVQTPYSHINVFAEYKYFTNTLNMDLVNGNNILKVTGDYAYNNVILGIKYTF